MKTAIVTDTNSGIFPKEGRLLGVYVLPMPLQIDGRTYYEGKDISVLQFYEYLARRPEVSTSQPAPGDVLALWDHALGECDELVYIPMSSGLSSSCHTAQALAKEYDGKVHVVDNHRISLPLRNSVLDAKTLANAGCTAAEIKESCPCWPIQYRST